MWDLGCLLLWKSSALNSLMSATLQHAHETTEQDKQMPMQTVATAREQHQVQSHGLIVSLMSSVMCCVQCLTLSQRCKPLICPIYTAAVGHHRARQKHAPEA